MNTPTKTQTWNERYRKNKAHIGAYIDRDLKRRVDELARSTGRTVTDVINLALERLVSQK